MNMCTLTVSHELHAAAQDSSCTLVKAEQSTAMQVFIETTLQAQNVASRLQQQMIYVTGLQKSIQQCKWVKPDALASPECSIHFCCPDLIAKAYNDADSKIIQPGGQMH